MNFHLARAAGALAVALALSTSFSGAAAKPGDSSKLGSGYRWGRCLLTIGGKTLINGKCGYQIRENGGFYIAGPRQLYEGVGYRNPGGSGFMDRSADYWAVIYHDAQGWTGWSNPTDVRATHGQVGFRPLTKHGACLTGETDAGQTRDGKVSRGSPVRICLWRR